MSRFRPAPRTLLLAAAAVTACAPLYVKQHEVATYDRAQLLDAAAASARAVGMRDVRVDSAAGRVVAVAVDTTLKSDEYFGCIQATMGCRPASPTGYHDVVRQWSLDVRALPHGEGRYTLRAQLDLPETGSWEAARKECVLSAYLAILDATMQSRRPPATFCGLNGAGDPRRVSQAMR